MLLGRMDWRRSMDARPYECLLLALVDLAFGCAMNNAAGSAGDQQSLSLLLLIIIKQIKSPHTYHPIHPLYHLSQSHSYFQHFPSLP